MKVRLMYKDLDFDIKQSLPSNEQDLLDDLELATLFDAMAANDNFLYEVAKISILSSIKNDVDTIGYRQDILKDSIKNDFIIIQIYNIAVEAIEKAKKNYWSFSSRYPSTILNGSIAVLQIFMKSLKELKHLADDYAERFESEGFKTFFSMIQREMSAEYFASVQNHLRNLKFRSGVLISAELGEGNKGTHYVLRKQKTTKQGWIRRLFSRKSAGYTYRIHPRDESGAKALSELRNRGINLVADALAQSVDHIHRFFDLLRTELAFYIGCLNLYGQLVQMGAPVCFPLPAAACRRIHSARGLYDACLALTMRQRIVGNDVNADNKDLVIITGANQGGKSTFLRSIGLSQLMMQAGMFVAAESFSSNLCNGLFTHFKREEDAAMESGKLDEELGRMSDILDKITSSSVLLFNESFAATNEREGSEIARQIVCALSEERVKIFFVTHLYEFAHGFEDTKVGNVIFLRAERKDDGARTFRLTEGKPLQTSYGEDLYNEIFLGRR